MEAVSQFARDPPELDEFRLYEEWTLRNGG